MPRLPSVRYGLTKPPPGAVLDREHPLVADGTLTSAVLMNEGGGGRVYDHAAQQWGALGSTVTWTASPFGPALDFPNDNINGTITFPSTPVFTHATWTVIVGFMARTLGGASFGGTFAAPGDDSNFVGHYFNGKTAMSVASSGSTRDTTSAVSLNAWHLLSASPLAGASELIVDGAAIANTGAGASGAAPASYVIGTIGGFQWDGQIAFLYIWNRILSDSERRDIALRPFSLFTTPSAVRRYWLFGISSGGGTVTAALTLAAGNATIALTAAEGVHSSGLTLAAGSATISLAGASYAGSLTLAASTATIALTGTVATTGALTLTAGAATISLSGSYTTGALTLAAGSATISLAGTATSGATSFGALTLGADTFTLAFDGALALASTEASISLAGASFTASALTLVTHGTTLALAATSDGATAILQLQAGGASIALSGQGANVGVLTLKAGSANAPLLHLVLPSLPFPPRLNRAVLLTASRSRAGGQALARLVPRDANGAALPPLNDPSIAARVTLRRVAGGDLVETMGRIEGDAEGLAIVAVWPASLPYLGLYYTAIEVDGQRCPPIGYVPVLVG